ncbi:MAG: hydroxyacid dehydrogenase [Candidatus Korobacteraceae bacterium]
MSHTIFVTAPKLAQAAVDRLKDAGCRILFMKDANSVAEVSQIMADEPVDAVISRTVNLTGDAIRACPTLKVISKHGVGVTNIDVEAATERGIPVYVTPAANAQSVAEMAIGLMLGAARKIAFMDHELHAGRWARVQDGLQLSGRTLGVIGFGQIGQKVARICLALDMRVVAFDPVLEGVASSLPELLKQSDVVSLHVPLLPSTRNMIGAAELEMLPAQAILVNTARGGVVDEAALVAALKKGRLFAAGLDTMCQEPLPADSPLAGLQNVVLTAHAGASTGAALVAMAEGAVCNVLQFLRGEPVDPAACINPKVL